MPLMPICADNSFRRNCDTSQLERMDTCPTNSRTSIMKPTRLPLKHLRILVALSFLMLISPGLAASQQIDWRIKDPFRLIKYETSSSDYSIPKGQSAFEFITARMATANRDKLPPIDDTHWKEIMDPKKRESYIFPKKQKATAWLTERIAGRCLWVYQERREEIDCSDRFEFEAITQFGGGDPTLSVKPLSGARDITPLRAVVRDRLILGLGDSFASGEGNPDKPTEVSTEVISELAKANANISTTGRWMKDAPAWVKSRAEWFDLQCHRSMFSQHVLAAMRIASANPRESVTLVPLACSGAEVMDGLLTPQKDPPGGGKRVSDSQLNLAVKYLCRQDPLKDRRENPLSVIRKEFQRGKTGRKELRPVKQDTYRCQGELRKPDAVLLSIGGNDVGFASAIAWATIPNGYRNFFGFLGIRAVQWAKEQVCPDASIMEDYRCAKNGPDSKYRIENWLPAYYKALAVELDETELAPKGSRKVYLTAYPNLLRLEDGETLCDEDRSEDAVEQVRTRLKSFLNPRKWQLEITKEEMNALQVGFFEPITREMKIASNNHGWTFVDSHVPKMIKNGICSGYQRKNGIVNYPHVRNGGWYPERPDQIWAYDTTRQRWFRNTNDSVLFQTDGSAGYMNGAFHPDFRAHALIADELFTVIGTRW